MSVNKIFFWLFVGIVVYGKNDILTIIEKISKDKLEDHKKLKEIGQLTMNKKNFFKKEEAKLTKASKEKVDNYSDELDMLSNQKIKSYRLRYDIEHLIIITNSIKDSNVIIARKFKNFLDTSYNEILNSILKPK